MKRIGELMSEMGFRKDAPESVKEAFLKHLIRDAEDVHVTTPTEKSEIEKSKIPQIAAILEKPKQERKREACDNAISTQLSFNFEDENKVDVSEVS